MTRIMLTAMVVLVLSLPVEGAGSKADLVRESMERIVSGSPRIQGLTVAVTAGDREEIRRAGIPQVLEDTVQVFKAEIGDSIAGYGIAFDVRGKDQPITCLLMVDRALRVVEVRILAYREAYGGEVRNPSWLKQFAGRGPGEPIRPGREIRTITGATISSRSVTEGVKGVLALLALVTGRPPFQEISR